MRGDLFELRALNQWSACCAARAGLTISVNGAAGGVLLPSSSPLAQALAIPRQPEPGAQAATMPRWYLRLDGELEQVVFALLIDGPGGEGAAWLDVTGRQLPALVRPGPTPPVDEVFRDGVCGILGHAEVIKRYGQPTLWRYTLTVGCCLVNDDRPLSSHRSRPAVENEPRPDPVVLRASPLRTFGRVPGLDRWAGALGSPR